MAHSTYIDSKLPQDFTPVDGRGDDLINNPEASCYFCGLHIGKEAEELSARLLGSTDTNGKIDFEVLKTVGDYFKPAVYICRSGDDVVAHENCLQWGEDVWQPTTKTMTGVDRLIDHCETYTCNLCTRATRASVMCTGKHCYKYVASASTYHFPCILILFLNGMADMETQRGDLAIRCVDCFVNREAPKKKRCRFIDDGAQEAEQEPLRHRKVRSVFRNTQPHNGEGDSENELMGL
jgi:hypothetical protein